MLFGGCNCMPVPSSVSRRALICGGGAGFVSALVGTLVGTGRTARAQALASRVPEVDRLTVTIVTDTQIIKFILTEKRNDLTIERRPAGNVRPDAPPRADLVGSRERAAQRPDRFWLHAGDAQQQRLRSQARPHRTRCPCAQPRTLRSFRRADR